MVLPIGGQGAEEVHALRQGGDINICPGGLQHALAIEGVDLNIGKFVGGVLASQIIRLIYLKAM